jgi:PAS domain S-box-containing protein
MEHNSTYSDDILKRDSERFRLVAKATHDVIWDWDLLHNTLWWNEEMNTTFGYDWLEPGPESWYNRIHPDDKTRVIAHILDVIESGGSNWTDNYRFKYADGTYAHVHDRGYTIHEDGKAVRMVGAMQDVTQELVRKRALEESQERLSFALKSAQLGTWTLIPDSDVVEWDERCCELFGLSKFTLTNYQAVLLQIHPEDRFRVQQSVTRAMQKDSGGYYNIQFRTIGADGHSLHWLHCKGQAYFKGEKAYRLSGIAQDITDLISNQERAFYADQQATITIEGTGAGSFLVDMNTNDIVYSATLCNIITGQISETLSRKIFIEHLHPEDVTIRNDAYELAAETGKLDYEARFIWNDGSVHWAKVLGRYLYDKSGKAVSLSGIMLDITDRVEAETKIRDSEEHFRSLIEQAPVATALFVGPDMIVDIPNESMLKIWGKGSSVIGKPLREAVPELIGQPFLAILDQVYHTGIAYHAYGAQAELVIGGVPQTMYFDFTYKPLLDKNGHVFAIMDMAVDVTPQVIAAKELKANEEKYRQLADELEVRVQQRTNELHTANQELINSNNSLQQFAYAASHDMQEPLRKIQSFSSRLQSTYRDSFDENGTYMLNRMQDAAQRMSLMIDDLLAYSRLSNSDQHVDFIAVDLNKVITQIVSDLEIGIMENNAVISVGVIPPVFGSPSQLVQLMQNLISNALKYKLPHKNPVIDISGRIAGQEELQKLTHLIKAQHYVVISIKDNGIGFDEKNIDRIFQMFQRLHGRGEYNGSGIGLALCKKVVQNHNGHITAQSEPGEGATFLIYLPLAQ